MAVARWLGVLLVVFFGGLGCWAGGEVGVVRTPVARGGLPPVAVAQVVAPVVVAVPQAETGVSEEGEVAAEDGVGESGMPPRLALGDKRLVLPVGGSVVEVELSPGAHHSIGIFGDVDALLGVDVLGPGELLALRRRGALEEDGLLPRMISFVGPPGVGWLRLWVDCQAEVVLVRDVVLPVMEPPLLSVGGRPVRPAPVPLVGLPAAFLREDGYLLQSPGRYLFVRADVAGALLEAFAKTRVRFKRDPIAVGDISQWDGRRPKSDLGQPRHISHEGGRDVDVALPASDGEGSTLREHCDGVLVEADAKGCAPGTVRGLDSLRLAFLLGFLFDMEPEGRIEKVFIDDAYIREIRRSAEVLRKRKWVKDVGYESLMSDEIIRKSPWHLDHFHIRFAGAEGVAGFRDVKKGD